MKISAADQLYDTFSVMENEAVWKVDLDRSKKG